MELLEQLPAGGGGGGSNSAPLPSFCLLLFSSSFFDSCTPSSSSVLMCLSSCISSSLHSSYPPIILFELFLTPYSWLSTCAALTRVGLVHIGGGAFLRGKFSSSWYSSLDEIICCTCAPTVIFEQAIQNTQCCFFLQVDQRLLKSSAERFHSCTLVWTKAVVVPWPPLASRIWEVPF